MCGWVCGRHKEGGCAGVGGRSGGLWGGVSGGGCGEGCCGECFEDVSDVLSEGLMGMCLLWDWEEGL